MAPITVTARPGAPEDTAADTRVVGVFDDDSLADPALQRLIELGEAKTGLTSCMAKSLTRSLPCLEPAQARVAPFVPWRDGASKISTLDYRLAALRSG